MSIGLLLVRIIIGLGLAAHGAQKLFGWFGGYGPAGTGGWMESMGWRPGVLFAVAAGLGEFAGGILVALGFLGGVGPALMILVMVTAILTVHLGKGFFTANNGAELPSLYIAGAIAVAFAGFGVYSLDHVFGWNPLPTVADRWIAIGIAVVLSTLSTFARRRPSSAIGAK